MNAIKKIIKKIPFLMYYYRNLKLKKEFDYDRKFFIKNYMYSKESKNTIGYNILLLAHALEKGMSNRNLRCFGKERAENLINELEKYHKITKSNTAFEFIIGINVLREYINVYEKNKWINKDEYLNVKKYLEQYSKIEKLNMKTSEISKSDIMNYAKIDYSNFLQSRHSIRSFEKRNLKESDIKKAISMSLHTPSACNRQMCKIHQVKNKKLVNFVVKKGQGFGGFEVENANIFIITFDINANYFVGERNQGWFNAGLLSMNFVNSLHSLGIGSCFIQFGNPYVDEVELKKKLGISNSERIAVILAAGYYNEKNLVTVSPRKNIDDIYKIVE